MSVFISSNRELNIWWASPAEMQATVGLVGIFWTPKYIPDLGA